jgi:hypothetical protein
MDRLLATSVVLGSVKKVGHRPTVSEDDKLRNAGIGTDELVENLVDVITNDRNVGVPSKAHRIDPNTLHDVDPDTQVGDVSDIVADNSTPVEPRQ